MKKLKLGILGMSEGNGHPYSWSAICNGYDHHLMKKCPFPMIPDYLAKQKFPQDQLKNATVTHIWTQNKKISHQIARATFIQNIVEQPQDMINQVDAILLARDDAENHLAMAKPFLQAGLPIYIDKPLALDMNTAKQLLALQKYPGQIFTCSALAFAHEFHLNSTQRKKIGKINYIDGIVAKSWNKYLIHILEPIFQLVSDEKKIKSFQTTGFGEAKTMTLVWQNGLKTTLSTLGNDTTAPICIRIFGESGWVSLEFKDTYAAFKKALQAFIKSASKRQSMINTDDLLVMIDIIEKGNLEHV